MAIIIDNIEKYSPAYNSGIKPGDSLISINGHEIVDVLDFRFYQVNSNIEIILERSGKTMHIPIKKGEYEELGMLFNSYLIDKEKRCKNKCIFCFIDQLPKGMRDSLYFKDDDSRLSFLFGNYITLTNLSNHEIDRIINMHISPINISVHTTNKELRCKMMGNRFAGDSLDALYKFAENGIKINCQLVMCRGVNDQDELISTLNDLLNLGDSIECIALVPVGITQFRDSLYPLLSYDESSSLDIIEMSGKFQELFMKKYGRKTVFAADEFYLKANLPLPSADFYEDFNQLENGVGMLSLLKQEFSDALESSEPSSIVRNITIACGTAAYSLLDFLSKKLHNRFPNVDVRVIQVNNKFFGNEITVSGLITGKDLINTLKDTDLGQELLITSSMLNSDGNMFLDNVTLDEAETALGVKITPVDSDGYLLLEHIIGK